MNRSSLNFHLVIVNTITLFLLIQSSNSFPTIKTNTILSTSTINTRIRRIDYNNNDNDSNIRKISNYKLTNNNDIIYDPQRRRRRSNASILNPQHHLQVFHSYRHTKESTSTQLNVLTTPESIIEQASTRKLLDDLIDESVRLSARKPIMMQFQPTPYWIWKCWKGTIFSESWPICLRNMAFAFVVSLLFNFYPSAKNRLIGFNILWGQLLSVTTFTLTFFLNVSYGLWRKCYGLSRRLQGRLNDLGLTLASHAVRNTPSNPTELSTYTYASKQILELVSRYTRLFNILTYASFTRSHRPILTPRGMRRLTERGLMTPIERQALIDADVPATQRHNAVLMWIVRIVIESRSTGHFLGGAGFESEFLEKMHVIRATVGGIGDELQGRMPLAYAHIVQVLVDVILLLYPFMAYTSEMNIWLGVLGTGLLTIFYQGLFDLAKQFLDPYDNENFGNGDDPLCVDTLVAETNAGSIRWMNGFNEMPFSSSKILEGELQEYLLPLKGYSVQELKKFKMEQEEREVKQKLDEERARQMKILAKRAKRLELLNKYYNTDYNIPKKNNDGWVVKKTTSLNDQSLISYELLSTSEDNDSTDNNNEPNKSNNNEDGWVIKKITSLNDQTIILYELLSTTDENVTMTAVNGDGLMEHVNTTKSITKSIKTMPYVLNDTDVSELLIRLLSKASNHLVYSIKNPRKKKIIQEQKEKEHEYQEIIGNWTDINNDTTISLTSSSSSTFDEYNNISIMSLVNNITTIESSSSNQEHEDGDDVKDEKLPFYHNVSATSAIDSINGHYNTTNIPTFNELSNSSSSSSTLLNDVKEEYQEQLDVILQKENEEDNNLTTSKDFIMVDDQNQLLLNTAASIIPQTINGERLLFNMIDGENNITIEEKLMKINGTTTTTEIISINEESSTILLPNKDEVQKKERILYDDELMYKLYNDEEDDSIINNYDYNDLWLDEISPDGTEIRLSQLMADDDDDDDYDAEYIIKQKQQYEEKIEKIRNDNTEESGDNDNEDEAQKIFEKKINAANEEWKETEAILKASPGLDSNEDDIDHDRSDNYFATSMSQLSSYEQKQKLPDSSNIGATTFVDNANNANYYDQTASDSVSQLWGASSSILGNTKTTTSSSSSDNNNNAMFVANVDGIADLWSGSNVNRSNNQGSSSIRSSSASESIDNLFPSLSTLWGVEKPSGTTDKKMIDNNSYDNSPINSNDNDDRALGKSFDDNTLSYWFDEIGSPIDNNNVGGNEEMRLSQLLADDDDDAFDDDDDDDWGYTNINNGNENNVLSKPDATTNEIGDDNSNVISIQDVIDKLEEEEEERLETEAILNAEPGANWLDDDDDENNDVNDIINEDNINIDIDTAPYVVVDNNDDSNAIIPPTIIADDEDHVMDIEEILETEAILNAAPGASSLDEEHHDDDQEDINTDPLEVLEMDVIEEENEEEIVEQVQVDNNNTTTTLSSSFSDVILVDNINLMNDDILSDVDNVNLINDDILSDIQDEGDVFDEEEEEEEESRDNEEDSSAANHMLHDNNDGSMMTSNNDENDDISYDNNSTTTMSVSSKNDVG